MFFDQLSDAKEVIYRDGNLYSKFGTKVRCSRVVGKYKVYSDRKWQGNGFGYDTFLYIVDTETKQIKQNDHYWHTSLKGVIDQLKKEITN